jgi:hypothetical protein
MNTDPSTFHALKIFHVVILTALAAQCLDPLFFRWNKLVIFEFYSSSACVSYEYFNSYLKKTFLSTVFTYIERQLVQNNQDNCRLLLFVINFQKSEHVSEQILNVPVMVF